MLGGRLVVIGRMRRLFVGLGFVEGGGGGFDMGGDVPLVGMLKAGCQEDSHEDIAS